MFTTFQFQCGYQIDLKFVDYRQSESNRAMFLAVPENTVDNMTAEAERNHRRDHRGLDCIR